MRSKFDAQLKELGEKLTLMGAMCEEAIANSAKALLSGDSELAAMRPMAEAAIGMVTDSIEAYNKRDLALAKSVIEHDDVVDDCFLSMKTALIEMIRSGSGDAEDALDLLMIAKYFERIGDHATNVAEWVEFSVTGIHKSSEI